MLQVLKMRNGYALSPEFLSPQNWGSLVDLNVTRSDEERFWAIGGGMQEDGSESEEGDERDDVDTGPADMAAISWNLSQASPGVGGAVFKTVKKVNTQQQEEDKPRDRDADYQPHSKRPKRGVSAEQAEKMNAQAEVEKQLDALLASQENENHNWEKFNKQVMMTEQPPTKVAKRKRKAEHGTSQGACEMQAVDWQDFSKWSGVSDVGV